MKTIKLLGILLIISFKLYSQGSNNDFDYDNEDFNIIFRELGISAFKFPVQQNSNQIFDIVIEEYENKELIKKISIIDDSKDAFGKFGISALSYFQPKTDSVYFHRFYFFKTDSIVKIKTKSHGIEVFKKFSLTGKSSYNINTNGDVSSATINNQPIEINDEPKILLYLYANSIDEKDKPLWCPNGLSKEQLIEKFYYLIFITIEKHKE